MRPRIVCVCDRPRSRDRRTSPRRTYRRSPFGQYAITNGTDTSPPAAYGIGCPNALPPCDEDGEDESQDAVRQLHYGGEADREAGGGPPDRTCRRPQQERDRRDDERRRERLGVEREGRRRRSTAPFSHAEWPASWPLARGQTATSPAATIPTARRPVAYSPTYAVATTVTAIATRLIARPTTNAMSGPAQPATRSGKSGIDSRSGHPNTAAPGGCIPWIGSVSASDDDGSGEQQRDDARRRRSAPEPERHETRCREGDAGEEEQRTVRAADRRDELARGSVEPLRVSGQRLVAVER